jgi:methylmalonyl-CoA/ethylmalonyl-CoA epimerase
MLKLNHIGIAVKNIDNAISFYKNGLGLKAYVEDVAAMKVRTAKMPAENVVIELIEPLPGEEAVTKFLEKRGEGIHHLCFEVKDIKSATLELINKGYKPIYNEPKIGAGGHLVNFLSPKDTGGVLIEITEEIDTIKDLC